MNETILKNVTKRYGSDYALKSFSYEFPNKGLVALLGRSGSGKSTLLGILSGMDFSYEGVSVVLGQSLKALSEEERTEFRMKNIGYVFQSFNLIELETAFDNVYFPLDAASLASKEMKRSRAMELLRFVGLQDKAEVTVNRLSGGEKQRVAFARALSCSPKLLLCDEPTANLDAKNASMVFNALRAYAKNHLAIVVTHDENFAFSYADIVLGIDDGVLISEEEGHPAECKTVLGLAPLPEEAEKSSLSSAFVHRHASHMIKNKRVRSILSRASLSLGLTGLGLSLYIATSISGEISKAFDAIVPENQVIVEPRSKPESLVSGIKASTPEKMEYLCRKYDEIEDWGTSIYMNYEQVFTDDDTFTVLVKGKSFLLPSFRIRHINEFLWIEEAEGDVLPFMPSHMSQDEVVLGLPFQNMASFCFNLEIQRSYSSLGDYIAGHDVQLIQFIANSSIGFYNEDLYRVIGICKSEVPTFYHLNHRWNHDVLINHLNFRSTSSLSPENVQQVPEIPYVKIKGDKGELLRRIAEDKATEEMMFEQADDDYLPSQCSPYTPCLVERLYVYEGRRSGMKESLRNSLAADARVKGSALATDGGYCASASSFLQGFSGKAFLSDDENSLLEASESCASLQKEYANKALDLPENVFDGSLYASNHKFRYSGNCFPLVSGKAPSGPDEVVISSSLSQKLRKPDFIYLTCTISEEEISGRIIREFRTAKLQVTGVKNSNNDELCGDANWTFDFFVDRLGLSSFYLEPSASIFYFSSEKDAASFLGDRQKAFPDLAFYSPRAEVEDSISGVANYIGGVLALFSAIALSMSTLLFVLTMSVTISENQGEAALLHAMGVSWQDISRIYHAVGLHYGLSSFGGSCFAIIACAVAVGFYVSSSFATAFSFSFPWIPFLSVLGFLGLFLVSMNALVKKKMKARYGFSSTKKKK